MKLRFAQNAQGKAQPDPYIIKADDGFYYLYVSGVENVGIYRSSSPEGEWEYRGAAFEEEGFCEYWAPCVVEENGVYYMYYSSVPQGCDDMHEQAIKIATSDRPDGKFVYRKTMIEPFSIDAHVVKSGGEYYIFYSCNDYEAERAGTYIAVDKMLDLFTAEGNPVPVVLPTLDEEIFLRDRFRVGQNWHTIEGAFYFRKGDDHYLMYSGNCYQSQYYFIGYAYAHGAENDLRRLQFRKMPDECTYAPLLCRNREETGTGHNSVLEENGVYYIVYHGRDAGADEKTETRTARIKRFTAEGGVLKLS
ncbi:MAG: family 43 glycosylhydrolase [Clostridia bacterium]|nr:family 43 glycosylhydrolase [Clostridia bacterium]